MTIKAYLNQVKEVRNNLLDESEKIIYENENDIIKMQTQQLEEGEGHDDNILKNDNPIFSGRYTLATQLINPSKIAGELYTFFDTGEFLGNMQINVSSDKTYITIFSTGTGSGDKKKFFDGYDNLFGLTSENAKKLNWEILYPEILNYLNTKI